MFVKNHMTTNPINIPSDTPVYEALTILKRQKIRQLPVVDDGRLVGLVTERDLLTVSPSPATALSIHEINYLLSKMTVREVMIKNPTLVSQDTTIEEAAVIMREHKFGSLLVVEDKKLIGIITESDLFDAIVEIFGFRRAGTRLVLETENRTGALADLLSLVRDHGVNVIGLAVVEIPELKIQVTLRLATSKLGLLEGKLKEAGFQVNSICETCRTST